MTPNPSPATRDPAPGPGDQRCKTAGLQLIMRMASTIRIGRTYQAENQVFVQQLQGLIEVLQPLLDESGEAVLVALQDDLYLNGVRIPVKANNFKFHRSMLEEFRRRDIAGLRLQKGVDERELTQFFKLFLQPDVYAGTTFLSACLAQGIDHVTPAIHASTEAPDDGFDYDPLPQWDAEEPAAPSDPGGSSGWGSGNAPGGEAGVGTGDTSAGGTPGPGLPGGRAPKGAARKNYAQAVSGARSLLATTTLQDGLELRHGKRVVQPLVDGAFSGEPVVVGLSSLTHKDEYTYAHAVNVCLVAVTMGRLLDMDRRALADLGVAALLHDVGKSAVSALIHHPIDAFTPEEQAAAERHPLEGAKLIARSTTLNQTTLRCMRVALEHHMFPDGSGYPAAKGRWPQSVMSRVVSVADCYVSLLGHRSERGANTTPYEALGMMLGPLRKRFDPAMLWALVNSVGFYPPGQLVLLDDGSTAEVLAPNPVDLARPHVRVIVSAKGERLSGEAVELHRPLPPERSVTRALKAEEYPSAAEDEAAA
ncbi:MAG TPA: HD domain-containing phosphohydrolase [Candidatus Eisenbacteria bacterium]|nr:HD domain-containing phosphohydrolase [Candidatus Eisenbacteria bacterium]